MTTCIDCGKDATGERCRSCRTVRDRAEAAVARRNSDRVLLSMRDQGLSLARIGVQLGGISAPAVRKRLQRAQLRETWRHHDA
jgi:hypothetical protein